jgi:hypothetical protein
MVPCLAKISSMGLKPGVSLRLVLVSLSLHEPTMNGQFKAGTYIAGYFRPIRRQAQQLRLHRHSRSAASHIGHHGLALASIESDLEEYNDF